MRDMTAMRDLEIERRLRLPAPEEPAFLPALVLPIREGSDRLGEPRIRARFLESSRPSWVASPRMVVAVVALLLAMIVAVAAGAMRLNLIPNPFDPDAGLRMRGISIDIPEGWFRLTQSDPLGNGGAFTALIVSNKEVSGCSDEEDLPAATHEVPVPSADRVEGAIYSTDSYAGIEDRIFECIIALPMTPGEIRVVLSRGYPQRAGVGPIEPFDASLWFGPEATLGSVGPFYIPTEDDAWTEIVAGMPAKLVVEPGGGAAGSDEVRTWGVFEPAGMLGPWFVRASLRGPDLDALREQADAMARSLRFERTRPELDEALRDEALASAIDSLDRETRLWQGSDLYGCFPRTPGERQGLLKDRLFEYGPDGPLAEPVPVTCATTVEATPLRLWHATLIVSWVAGDGYPAGRWGYELFFDATVSRDSAGGGTLFGPEVASPGGIGTPPPPLTQPLVIPLGSIVQILPPGIDRMSGPVVAYWEDPNETFGELSLDLRPGRRLHVLDGPLLHAGTDWYLVALTNGVAYGGGLAWIPATDGDRPLVEVVDPRCPTGPISVADLVWITPAERVLCLGGSEVTIEPAVLWRVDAGDVSVVEGTPEWLAATTLWRLSGIGGETGVEPPLAVAIHPTLGDNVPTGVWLTIRGHFDDPASAECRRTQSEGALIPEPPTVQVMLCRELFVITSFDTRDAP